VNIDDKDIFDPKEYQHLALAAGTELTFPHLLSLTQWHLSMWLEIEAYEACAGSGCFWREARWHRLRANDCRDLLQQSPETDWKPQCEMVHAAGQVEHHFARITREIWHCPKHDPAMFDCRPQDALRLFWESKPGLVQAYLSGDATYLPALHAFRLQLHDLTRVYDGSQCWYENDNPNPLSLEDDAL
jgi:hypothetical protein